MKIFIKAFLLIASLAIIATDSFALQVQRGHFRNRGIFSVAFPDGTSFFARNDKICALTLHRYSVASIVITEVNIQIEGQPSLIRIYNAAPIELANDSYKRACERLPDELKSFAPSIPNMDETPLISKAKAIAENATKLDFVAKDYPITTHAKTVEYIVDSLDELMLFYARFSNDYASPTDSTKLTSNSKNTTTSTDERPLNISGTLYTLESEKSE